MMHDFEVEISEKQHALIEYRDIVQELEKEISMVIETSETWVCTGVLREGTFQRSFIVVENGIDAIFLEIQLKKTTCIPKQVFIR